MAVLSSAVAVLTLAVWCWPVRRAALRLSEIGRHADNTVAGIARDTRVASPAVAGVAVATGAGLLLFGPAGAVLGAVFGVLGKRSLAARASHRERVESISGVAEAIGGLVSELRTGAHPASAAETVAQDAHRSAAVVLRGIASTARIGGDVVAGMQGGWGAVTPGLRGCVRRIALAWDVATRHGVPLADALDAVRRDLDSSGRYAAAVHAKLAGPRASAAVLAGLPALGIGLGELMGAAPVHVLASTGTGQILLLLGGSLLVCGLAWTARITTQAAPI